MKCKFCGCTDNQACEGGCHWVMPRVCSQCAAAAIAAFAPLRVHYLFDTNYRPRGLRLEKGIEGVTYKREGTLEFLPSVGIEIDPGDGDLRKVEGVYYFPEERRVDVYFVDEEAVRPHAFMLQHGWVLA